MNTMQARTLLVGGDGLFREGLKRLFTDTGVQVLGEADGLEAVADRIDRDSGLDLLLLLEVADDAADLATSLVALRERAPGLRVVVVTATTDPDRFGRAIDAGVDGYLLRDISRAALLQSLGLVMLGENVFPTRLTADVLGGRPVQTPGLAMVPLALTRLNRREKAILRCLIDGHQNREIAGRLGLTEATVKVQVRRLLGKIGVANRTQAAIWAIRQIEDGRLDGAELDDEADAADEGADLTGAPALAV
jgi:two-component system nitrate/nitrite response regulator NarL